MSGWAAAAAVAVTAGVGAVALAQGGSLAGPEQPMSEDDVLQSLEAAGDETPSAPVEESSSSAPADAATATPSAETPTGQLETTPSAAADGHVLGGDGGTFQAVCEGDQVRLTWWVPAQGWSTGTVDPGPAALASIAFTGGGGDDDDDDGLVYEVSCAGGVPAASLGSDDDDDADD